MTSHYFETALVKLHYYKFGNGEKKMLCFHGFGMHGKQFKDLQPVLGGKYTFYSFDLFFHKATKLTDQSLSAVKKGISKQELAGLIAAFCEHEHIERFSVMGYSMGTHYATVVVEEMAEQVDEYIAIAPSSVNPGKVIRYFSANKTGNKIFEKMALSKKTLISLLGLLKRAGLIDTVGRDILYNEISTDELRFNLYACLTFLRFLDTDETKLLKALNDNAIRSVFIFGKRDRMYPLSIGATFLPKVKNAEVIVLDETHEIIDQNFVNTLAALL